MILNPFKGKNILITGGSKGIGLEMAKELARLKANVAIIARDKAALDEAQKVIEASGEMVRCLAYACDVTDIHTLTDYVNMVRYEFGSIDGVIANSGYCHPGNFHEIDITDFDRQVDVNLKGVLYTLRLTIPHLLESGSGFIAITSSPAGNAGIFGFGAYGPTKAALNNLSHVLRQEYKANNIRVHLLLPPDTDTPGYQLEVPLYPKETKAILDGGVLLDPEPVAKKFITGIANGKKRIGAGFSTSLLLFLLRFAPFTWDWYTRSKIRKARKLPEGDVFIDERNPEPPEESSAQEAASPEDEAESSEYAEHEDSAEESPAPTEAPGPEVETSESETAEEPIDGQEESPDDEPEDEETPEEMVIEVPPDEPEPVPVPNEPDAPATEESIDEEPNERATEASEDEDTITDDEPEPESEPEPEDDSPVDDPLEEVSVSKLDDEPDEAPEIIETDLVASELQMEFEDLRPFLDRITKYAVGLDAAIPELFTGIAEMEAGQSRSWNIDTMYDGGILIIRIETLMNDDDTLNFTVHAPMRLAMIIEQERDRMQSGI